MGVAPARSRQGRPRAESFVVQAVSEKIAPPKGGDGGGFRAGPPQALVPGTFVVRSWWNVAAALHGKVVVVVEVVVVLVVEVLAVITVVVVVLVVVVVVVVVGQAPLRGWQMSVSLSVSRAGLPLTIAVSLMRFTFFLLCFAPPLSVTGTSTNSPHAADPSSTEGGTRGAPAFAGFLSGLGVQPDTLVWFRHTA